MTGTTSRPPRRSALLRVTTVVAAVVPLCTAGWLGWRALDDSGPAGATAATASATATAPAGTADPAATPLTPPVAPPPTGGTPTADAPTATPAPADPTTASGPTTAPAATGLAGRTVVLDPGHNPGNVAHPAEINRQVDIGNARKECDTTGTETNAGYTEAEFTLDVSRRARAILAARGAHVVLVQDGDRPWGPCIDERAKAGADAHADVAVSVHGDGGPGSGSGFHVIMPAKVVAGKADNSAIVEPSHRLGLLLRDHFHTVTGEPYADYIANQGLDTRSDLGGLNLSGVPKVFIECGNMRNSTDAKRMTDPQWRQLAAQGIADALTAFLTTQ
ncbi:N-acetylmuramoyl-L-alanine amidase [Streptomyces sp. 1114.5]|uniref:N-acetylmuramoyl-L-alanine amidase n=1 Tax=unclassified Streptomyces TaxID=2593676 RepID=UPI000BD4F37A|nr:MULTISPECIES: N-acetylmuramoyl-L-alanine amidase [unclassified Streptomyces]RKT18218.1 N-acetylmuramoyl-L-alanine amidase [Streptomyces sp. 1114.5]SOB84416.1 N-acetylmuramoyl-L-alanine amidase [Streptomyces sp. 1331.2]